MKINFILILLFLNIPKYHQLQSLFFLLAL
nr:MAG TPA: hypothetical protein [Caudoviricetes sp.]